MGLEMRLGHSQRLRLTLPIYASAGDIELFSLHRIRSRIPTLDVDADVKKTFIEQLLAQNQAYRQNTGKDWNCITGYGMETAVCETIDAIRDTTESALATLGNVPQLDALRERFALAVDQQDQKIKTWVSARYDELLYDTRGKIPYPIVRLMRARLAGWALCTTSPFDIPTSDLIDEAAAQYGLRVDDYERTWKELKKYT